MKTISINLYEYHELSQEAKAKAKKDYLHSKDFYFLSEDLTEDIKDYLNSAGVKYENIKIFYSLNYCQGDGLCFIGRLIKGNISATITHNCRYYFAESVNIEYFDEDGNEIDEDEELKSIYMEACKRAEKLGYDILEYEETEEELNEYFTSNGYLFNSQGTVKREELC